MDRRTRNLFALLLVAVLGITLGAALVFGETARPDPDAPPGTITATGVIVAVDSRGLGDVRGFTLRLAGGEELEFELGALENATEFPPGHLVEHQATAEPVQVRYREEGTRRVAIRLADAGE